MSARVILNNPHLTLVPSALHSFAFSINTLPSCLILSAMLASSMPLYEQIQPQALQTPQTTCPYPLHPVPRFPHVRILPFCHHFSAMRDTTKRILHPQPSDCNCKQILSVVPTLSSSADRRTLLSARGGGAGCQTGIPLDGQGFWRETMPKLLPECSTRT
jgi:hypothetical protein